MVQGIVVVSSAKGFAKEDLKLVADFEGYLRWRYKSRIVHYSVFRSEWVL